MTQPSSSSQREPPQQQELPLTSLPVPQPQQPIPELAISERPYTVLIMLLTLPFLYVFGPVVLTAQTIARWVWRAFSHEERATRIKGVKEAAWLFLLLYLPMFLLHRHIEALWTWCFTLLSNWTHLPLFSWIAAPALWPLTPQTLLYRWLLSIPLVYLWAFLWMTTDDRGNADPVIYKRVLLPEEAAQLQAAKEAEAKKIAQTSSRSTQPRMQTQKTTRQAATRTPRKAKAALPSLNELQATPPEATQQQAPKPDSLWGEIKWEQVPDTNPLKQAALQTKQETPPASTPPPSRPTVEPPQAVPPKKDDYDWESGDGSLSL